MTNTLLGLFNGTILPWERPNPSSAEQLVISGKIEEAEQYLSEKLSPEDRKHLEVLSDLHLQLAGIDENNTFSYAFSLGMLLMLDVTEEAKRMTDKQKSDFIVH